MSSHPGSEPIPRWRADREYFTRKDPRRERHLAHIEIQERINARICASAGDGSYSVVLTRKDM